MLLICHILVGTRTTRGNQSLFVCANWGEPIIVILCVWQTHESLVAHGHGLPHHVEYGCLFGFVGAIPWDRDVVKIAFE